MVQDGGQLTRIEHPCRVLYGAATGLERSLVDVGGGRIIDIPAEKIIDMWDPWAISEENLPLLAWAMQARMWESDWTSHTKREWTAYQWHFQALRGTYAGIEMALKYMGRDFTGGYNLLEALTAPQGFFAAQDLTKEEWDAWIRRMPQVRIKLAHGYGKADGEFFAAHEPNATDGFADVFAAGVDDGPALYGRRAVLRRPGQPDQELKLVEWTTKTETRQTVDFEQVCIPGNAGATFVADDDCADDDRYTDSELQPPKLYSFRLDGSYDHVSSQLHLSTISPGLEPIDVQFERDSDIGWGDSHFFGGDFADNFFADNGRDAYEMLADRVYLLDPTIAAPLMDGVSFADVDRVDYPPYQAELLIDLKTKEAGPAFFSDESAPEEAFAIADDFADFDRALRATVASKAFRDRALDDFEICHPLRFGDAVTETTKFGDQPRSWL